MKRRHFVGKVSLGATALLATTGAAITVTGRENERPGASQDRQQDGRQGDGQDDEHDGHHGGSHGPISGPLATATVAFGAWPASAAAPLDRMTTPDAPVAPNVHALTPNVVTIKAGGLVQYLIAGFHQIAVYGPDVRPSDIDTSVLLPIPGAPPEVGLIDDPTNRLYRGPSPLTLPQDRVEVVQFDKKGLYLVICAVSVHFADRMYGWVKVLR